MPINKHVLLTLALFGLLVAGAAMVARASALASAPPVPSSIERLYSDSCGGCHASGGRAPDLLDPSLLISRTDDQLLVTIRNGIPGTEMPAFAKTIDEQDSERIVAFLRSRAAEVRAKPLFVADPQGEVVRTSKQNARIEVVARGLETPWGLTFLPGERLLVTERPGRLRVIDKGKLLPDAVKGTPKVWQMQDAGLFDVAAHPDFVRTGWIYLSYAERAGWSDAGSMTVVVRGRISSDNRWIDEQVIFRAPAGLYTANNSHYGSRFLFDRKGRLFFSIGDRGAMATAQDLSSPLGKIHRVNDDGSIPADNPFVNREGAIASIWSFGHRNPQGLSWDPATGLLWSSEHGPRGGDEINIIEKGRNYGWGAATMGVQSGIMLREAPGMAQPIVHYTPRIAPSGLTFYDGGRYPGWANDLFVAGLAGQQLRRLEVSGRTVTAQEVVFDHLGRTRAAATGPDGLLYILLQSPTGGDTGLKIHSTSPGMVIRLAPLTN